MIRVLCVDDHEAVRAGLEGLVRTEPGMVAVGSAAGERELWPALQRTRPDVVLLDYQLPRTNGMVLCRRIKTQLLPPRVVIYSAYANDALALPARLARADALVDKTATAYELFQVIREVCRHGASLPRLTPRRREIAAQGLGPEELPILSMVLEDTPVGDIAQVTGIDEAQVGQTIERLISHLTSPGSRGAEQGPRLNDR
jgi:DNA-binding NarL/FixJ family response regulator